MKHRLTFLAAYILFISVSGLSQVDPGFDNLMHQWTFDDGTATDSIGNADGTLIGDAFIAGSALNTSDGGYLSLPAETIAVNTYEALSTEIWFTSTAGANTENTMMIYFGESDVDGWMGNNYIFTSAVNGGYTRAAISTGNTTSNPWSNEDGINTTSIDDGSLHHFVTIVDTTNISLYIDEAFISSTSLTGANSLSDVSAETAYLCKAGYTEDAIWKGLIHKYSIYNKVLSADEVTFLYEQGPEQLTSISSNKGLISFDSLSASETIQLTGYNLADSIMIITPDGVSATPSKLAPDCYLADVAFTYDGVTTIDSNISFTSGATMLNIQVKSYTNDCFTPLYPDLDNLIVDPTCNYYTEDGWGNTYINSDQDYVYCGSRSGQISNEGSLDRVMTGILKPNTTYRVRAMVYKKSDVEEGNMGNVTYTLDVDSASYPTPYNLIKEAMDSACGYFNKYTPFIENIYVYYNTGIPTAQASYRGSIGFGADEQYMWVGTAIHEMDHYFGSGTTTDWQSLMVDGAWTGEVANALMMTVNGTAISGDSQHFWPYGINYKSEITSMGSLAVQRQALANAVKIAKAMLVDDAGLPTNNPAVGIGIYGWDGSSEDIYHEVTVSNSWQEVDFTFTTGNSLATSQGIFFNRGDGYIDNWEMYELPDTTSSTISEDISKAEPKVYYQSGSIVTEAELDEAGDLSVFVYDLNGRLLKEQHFSNQAGFNRNSTDAVLLDGIYIVKIVCGDLFYSEKVLVDD